MELFFVDGSRSPKSFLLFVRPRRAVRGMFERFARHAYPAQ